MSILRRRSSANKSGQPKKLERALSASERESLIVDDGKSIFRCSIRNIVGCGLVDPLPSGQKKKRCEKKFFY